MIVSNPLDAVTNADTQRIKELHREQNHNDLNDMFQMLLLTELKHQDPLNPVSNTEFLSQLAQLNSLNELRSLNDALSSRSLVEELGQASTMIGKVVRGNSVDLDKEVMGEVISASIENGEVYLNFPNAGRIRLQDALEVIDRTIFEQPKEPAGEEG